MGKNLWEQWPPVKAEDWCGEWKGKAGELAPTAAALVAVTRALNDAVSVFKAMTAPDGEVFVSHERKEAWVFALRRGEEEMKRLLKEAGA